MGRDNKLISIKKWREQRRSRISRPRRDPRNTSGRTVTMDMEERIRALEHDIRDLHSHIVELSEDIAQYRKTIRKLLELLDQYTNGKLSE